MNHPVDRYWSQKLGVTTSELSEPGVHIVANSSSGLNGYAGVFFFSRGRSLVVSAPPELVEQLAGSIQVLSETSIMDREALHKVVGVEAGLVVGPAYQGFTGAASFNPPKRAERVSEADFDPALLQDLRTVSGEDAWEASGISEATGRVAVAVEQDRVVGAAGLRHREAGIADPCVLVQPDRRGRGLATALVGRVVGAAVEQGTVVLYQTLHSNTAAVRVAQRLGFDHYATTVAVRLTEAE